MIKPATDKLEAYQHSSFSHTWTFELDVSDSTFYCDFKKKGTTDVQHFAVTSGDHDVVIALTREQMEDLELGTYEFGLKEVVTANTSEKPRIRGEFIVYDFPVDEP